MNMYAICMDIWIFGGLRSRNKIRTNNSLSGHGHFFPILDKEITVLWFGRDLAAIWNIQIFGYLNIWTDRWIRQSPTIRSQSFTRISGDFWGAFHHCTPYLYMSKLIVKTHFPNIISNDLLLTVYIYPHLTGMQQQYKGHQELISNHNNGWGVA